jgi:hypothetical protein
MADSVLDNGMVDWLLATRGEEAAGGMIDAAHRAVRLGNPLICLSRMQDKAAWSAPFDSRFGWVQVRTLHSHMFTLEVQYGRRLLTRALAGCR